MTAGTPYSSGQQINLNVAANPVINTTNLANNGAPTTGNFYVEECTDPGGTTANLPINDDRLRGGDARDGREEQRRPPQPHGDERAHHL